VSSRLFHFSDDGTIDAFVPRSVRVAAPRPPGEQWLNGPLVWAVTEERVGTYLFPRDCPRIVLWSLEDSTAEDRTTWMSGCAASMLALVEDEWWDRLTTSVLYRYELPTRGFVPTSDAWMWVCPDAVTPMSVERLDDLPAALTDAGVELRVVDRLDRYREAWSSSLHVSGIRLRNATGWTPMTSQ
jgi:hypothetical protein